MRATKILLTAAGLAAALGGATGVQAAPRGGVYNAALATPLAAPRQQIVEGVLWKCAAGQCSGAADGSRPVLVCQRVVRTFGPVSRFTTPAGELSGEELQRCNGAS